MRELFPESRKNTMATPVTIKFSGFAYKGKYDSLESIVTGKERPTIFSCESANEYFDYIGRAECVVTIAPQDEIMAKQLESLNKQLQEQRAKAHRAEQAILEQISKLTALTFESK